MITKLLIRNYILIQDLTIDFRNGFCVITGETGAGKSIILGALSLILGQRADTSVLNDIAEKCIIEGVFDVDNKLDLHAFFEDNELDYDTTIVLRREIAPSGKTRAFINDTPVTLNALRELGLKLVDIHSQHSNLELANHRFQLSVVDLFGKHTDLINSYRSHFQEYNELKRSFRELKAMADKSKSDIDYFKFQFKQLDDANLIENEQVELEKEQLKLTHSEEIKSNFNQAIEMLDSDNFAIIKQMKELNSILTKMKRFLPEAESLQNRVESTYLDLKDVAEECSRIADITEHDPQRMSIVAQRLDLLFSLEQKHRLSTVEELIQLRNELDEKINKVESFDVKLAELEIELNEKYSKVCELANSLHSTRCELAPFIEAEIVAYLLQLGMPNAMFKIEINEKLEFDQSGKDEIIFQFSANKNGKLEDIIKVASGGEMSRVMLAIKAVIAKSKALPTIIFDEIDAGISGEIAAKMGVILKEMSSFLQVINITHLPQIASKGDYHYFVYKHETENSTLTGMRILTSDERVEEIAKMLSAENLTEAAFENARVLLGS